MGTVLFGTGLLRSAASGWSPSRLQNSDRTLITELDASISANVTTFGGQVSTWADNINSNNFVQAGGASATPLSDGTNLITFDGVGEFLEIAITTGNYQNLTYFELWAVIDVDQVNTIQILLFSKDGGNKDDRVVFTIAGDGQLQAISNNNSASVDHVRSNNVLTVGKHVIGIIADGSNYSFYADNVLVALNVVAGSNTGKMVGGLTNKTLINICTIASQQTATPNYKPNKEQYQLHIGGLSTAAATTVIEKTEIFNYMNTGFSLGL